MSPLSTIATLLPVLTVAAAVAAEPQVITITTPPGQMKYDRSVITAPPGSELKILFVNKDEMPHNIVFCRPHEKENDKGLEVAQEAWKLAEKGMELNWVPQHPRIWAHSKLVEAKGSQEILLKVPETPGTYPYVCTFPGHAMAMNGELRVQAAGPVFTSLQYKLFLGAWSQLPDFTALQPHRAGELADRLVDLKIDGVENNFGLLFNGRLEAPADGVYQFGIAGDDGVRVTVDGKKVVENDGIHPVGDIRHGKVKLTKGPHNVEVAYFEGGGQEALYVEWSGPTFSATPLSRWVHPERTGDREKQEDKDTGMPLIPTNGEAVMHRNFITGASPRGIGIGFPNGTNICFDADRMTTAMAWRGAFLDAKKHWTDRGAGEIQPLGFDVVQTGRGEHAGLALLKSPAGEWPTGKRSADIKFKGYRLDAKRYPAFRYELGNTKIEEHYETSGDYRTGDEQLTRVLRLTGAQPELHIMAAPPGMKLEQGEWRKDQSAALRISGGRAVEHSACLAVQPE